MYFNTIFFPNLTTLVVTNCSIWNQETQRACNKPDGGWCYVLNHMHRPVSITAVNRFALWHKIHISVILALGSNVCVCPCECVRVRASMCVCVQSLTESIRALTFFKYIHLDVFECQSMRGVVEIWDKDRIFQGWC